MRASQRPPKGTRRQRDRPAGTRREGSLSVRAPRCPTCAGLPTDGFPCCAQPPYEAEAVASLHGPDREGGDQEAPGHSAAPPPASAGLRFAFRRVYWGGGGAAPCTPMWPCPLLPLRHARLRQIQIPFNCPGSDELNIGRQYRCVHKRDSLNIHCHKNIN